MPRVRPAVYPAGDTLGNSTPIFAVGEDSVQQSIIVKPHDDVAYATRGQMKRFHNRLPLDGLRLSERYFDGEVHILVHFRSLVNPETPESEKHVLPKLQARILLESLPFRDRLMAMVAAFCVMRPGEIFGLRWSSWREDHFQIEGTAWRGTLRTGKAKTRGSKAPVTIPDVLLPLLQIWRDQHASALPDALIFPNEVGTPMRPENWLRRRLKPKAKAAGITMPVNFQVLRRTFATNAQGFGNAKDVQTHLRHSDISTTLGVYTQPIDANVRKLVNAVADDVMTSKPITERVQ